MNLLKREWREEKLLAWSFGGLWVFITAFLWAPSRDGLEGIYALAFFVPILLLSPWFKLEFNSSGGLFNLVALAYASWCCITSIWGDGSLFFILQWVILATWLLGSVWVLQKKSLNVDTLLLWFLVIGAVTASINVAVFYWNNPFSARVDGITVARAPTLVGQVYGVVILAGALLSWRTACFKRAIWFSLACLPALAAVGLSQSRGPLLSLVLVLVIGLLWLRPNWKIVLTQSVVGLLALCALFLVFPLDQLLLLRGASFRDQIWLDVITQMRAQPSSLLMGIGMAESTDILTSTGEYHHAHNAWLDIFYRTGAIGLALALIHLLLLLKHGIANATAKPLVLWLIYGCGCLLVDSRSLFWEIDVKWLLYWVPAALLTAHLSRTSIPTTISPANKQ